METKFPGSLTSCLPRGLGMWHVPRARAPYSTSTQKQSSKDKLQGPAGQGGAQSRDSNGEKGFLWP